MPKASKNVLSSLSIRAPLPFWVSVTWRKKETAALLLDIKMTYVNSKDVAVAAWPTENLRVSRWNWKPMVTLRRHSRGWDATACGQYASLKV